MPTKPCRAVVPNRFPARTLSGLAFAAVLGLSACAKTPVPSVPAQPGKSISEAHEAVRICGPRAPAGGKNAVTGSYIGGVLWGGLIIGPAIIAANEHHIRANGERRAIDKCLEEQGYTRREMTPEEIKFLNALYGYQRQIFLDHLVTGGTLAGFKQEYDVQ